MPIKDPRHPFFSDAWPAFRAQILARAELRCECTGECGLHRTATRAYRCTETHLHAAQFARGLVRLTIAHICKCDPPCLNPQHVRAMCQRCHLRTDRHAHAAARLATRRRAAAHSLGQSLAFPEHREGGGDAERSFERPLLEATGGDGENGAPEAQPLRLAKPDRTPTDRT